MSKVIMGIKLPRRRTESVDVQKILTEYGCFVKTRIGLHNASDDRTVCNEDGLILLELIKDCDAEISEMEAKLTAVEGVEVRKMEF